jgi:methyl-accepting chemotaxis protein
VRHSITAQFTFVVALVRAVVLAGFGVMLIAARNLQSADRSRTRSNAVLATSANLEESVLDLETGLRGYLLAGKPVFLEPYSQALGRYPRLARTL